MVVRGHVKDGVIVLDEDVRLEEGTRVSVEVEAARKKFPIHPDVAKMIGILPSDIDVKEEYRQYVQEKYR
jgi:hypothetical protein